MSNPSHEIRLKTFLKALNHFPHEVQKVKKYLNDKRLTYAEKTILLAWLSLRDSKNLEVIESLEKLVINDEIIELERNLLLGIAHNNKADFGSALSFLKEATRKIHLYPLRRQTFLAYYNLFIVYYNLMDESLMRKTYLALASFQCESKADKRALLFCRLCLETMANNHLEVKLLFKALDELEPETSESQIYAYQILKFNYFIQNEEFQFAQETLDKLKGYRKFQVSANFKFMKTLLSFLTENKPLYLYDQDFIFFPLLLCQVQVLKHLESSELEQASKIWGKLKELNPQLYGDEFEFLGQKNLFSLCLEKLKPKSNLTTNPSGCTKEEKLLNILKASLHPVRKEDLYKLVWGIEYSHKDDLNKLKTMVMKLRQAYGIEIQSKKGCYQIVGNKKKVA